MNSVLKSSLSKLIPRLFTLVLIAAISLGAMAAQHRSGKALRTFQEKHPCPSTGKTKGACKGWVKDHVVPLACGGADAAENLQWQTIADAKLKDKWERKTCKRK